MTALAEARRAAEAWLAQPYTFGLSDARGVITALLLALPQTEETPTVKDSLAVATAPLPVEVQDRD
jgi:hypothetical protein